ncbi:MAG: DUF1996 domain-containing protein [Granulosicoccus sp.]
MALRLFTLALVLLLPAGNAFADCTDTYLLPENQWHQISLPCAAPAGASTVEDVLGDDMGTDGSYGDNWILYAYNPANNTYSTLRADSVMIPGLGYWIAHATGGDRVLSMPSDSQEISPVTSSVCPGLSNRCTEAPLEYAAERAGELQYNMMGIPHADAYLWGNVHVTDNQACNIDNAQGGCTLADATTNAIFQKTAWRYTGTKYDLINSSSVLSSWEGMWAIILPDAQPDSALRLLLPTNPSGNTLPTITAGTNRRTAMDTSSETVAEQAHGTRVYCPVSHYSHDDPVVYPGEKAAAHLHMFWGNTQTDAYSTGESLLTTGNASCEGGLNNKSAYWAPALFNAQDETMLPESVFVYYKSFSTTAGFDRATIMPIPTGLQMLANQQVPNSGPWNFRIDEDSVNGNSALHFTISFPMCLQVEQNGTPVLSSEDNTSHLSYAVASQETPSDCPASHPYRIPQLIYSITYDVPFSSQWYLSSDHNPQMQGSSLHADYFAAWDEETMDRIVLCNREMKGSCEFNGEEDGFLQFRNQLPERFLSPEGAPVYANSVTLSPETDRTPFGVLLEK